MAQPSGKENARENPKPEAAEDPSAAKLKAVEAERDRLKTDLAEMRDRFLRARADYDNAVRRSTRELQEAGRGAKAAVLHRWIGIVETLEKALVDLEKAHPDSVKGLRMVYDDARKALKEEGVREIEGVGTSFNYRFHQAVERVETDAKPEGHILDVIQRGYLLGDDVLRPALVRVAVTPKAPPKEEATSKSAPASPKAPTAGGA